MKGKHGITNSPIGRSGEKYVTSSGGKYIVFIPIHGKRMWGKYYARKKVGTFNTLEEAVEARDKYLSI